MSITLNNSDFQCLQDQLVDLKTKNYELAEKNRRGQADFEAAKAKICSLQLKLEEQERDFQVTSSTLRHEIELAYKNNGHETQLDGKDQDDDYKIKYKKLLPKARELQQRYEKSVEVIQQLDDDLKSHLLQISKLEDENAKQRSELERKNKDIEMMQEEYANRLKATVQECDDKALEGCKQHIVDLDSTKADCDRLRGENQQLNMQVKDLEKKVLEQSEERKITERKGLQTVKELKRQLNSEKTRSETLQARIEQLLMPQTQKYDQPSTTSSNPESEIQASHISASSSLNGNSSSNGTNSAINSGTNNLDANSLRSWSFVPDKSKAGAPAQSETLSICSVGSEDRETVQNPSIMNPGSSPQDNQNSSHSTPGSPRYNGSANMGQNSPSLSYNKPFVFLSKSPSHSSNESKEFRRGSRASVLPGSESYINGGILIEEQAALMERITRLQHEKWNLEERLSYMEQANSALAQDLADKSDIIKHYFMEQAQKSAHQGDHASTGHGMLNHNNNSRRISFPTNFNHLISDTPSLKKVVDLLKEKSQAATSDNEAISREATKKMQIMLEETLTKCLKLQENLDFVTSELNRLQQ